MLTSLSNELFKRAAPDCPECEEPIIRTEFCYHVAVWGEWEILRVTMVCPNQHRRVVYDAD